MLVFLFLIHAGRLPSQTGVHDWINRGNGCADEAIDYTQKEVAYTDILSSHDYYCAISGKYHLGDQQHAQHSFQHWFVHQSGGGPYNTPPMVNESHCVNIEGYVTDIITDDAIKFIDNYAKDGNKDPFYLSVHYTSPHAPYTGSDGKADSMHPKEIVELYNDTKFVSCPQEPRNVYATHFPDPLSECLGSRECLKGYYAAVTAMDMNIGKILATISSNSLDESTLVVFTSDHGFNAGHHGLWGKGNAAYPLNMFETSIRIPMIWRHVGVLTPSVENSVVQVLDIAPTILQYAGNFSFPKHLNTPGESFLDLLTDTRKRNSRTSRTIYGEYGQMRYIRVNATMKYVTRLSGQLELYDLTSDEDEKINLLSPFTDSDGKYDLSAIAYERALRQWFSYYDDPYVTGWTRPVTGKGQNRAVYYNASGWPTTPAFNNL